YLAAVDTSTGLATPFNPDCNGPVRTIAFASAPSPRLYIGGEFTTVGGLPRSHLAAVALDGSVLSWSANADGNVNAIAVGGSTVYVGGEFNSIGGLNRIILAAVDGTTGIVTAWNASLGSVAVDSLVVSGNSVFVGGNFSFFGNTFRTCL